MAKRLGKPEFEKALNVWLVKLGEDKFANFMRNSVAARLGKPEFEKALNYWLGKLDRDNFTKLMQGSVAARLDDPEFDTFLKVCLAALGPEELSRVMRDGVAARYRVLGGFVAYLAEGATRWNTSMLIELCRRVPLGQTDPVAEEVWLGIVSEKQQKLEAADKKKSRRS